jgi:hypothetical protein
MKTKHEKLITSLLALGLVGVSPVGAQSNDSQNTTFVNNQGLVISNTINEDLNNDGNLDTVADIVFDTDGRFDFIDETNIVEVGAGPVVNGVATDLDINGDGVIQQTTYAFDLDGDGFTDLGNEIDFDGDGVIDVGGEDFGNDGRLTLGEDTDNDGNLDIDESAIAGTDQDGNLDSGEVDIDGDGRFDVIDETNIIEVGAGPVVNGVATDLDINGDGVIQQTTYAFDLDGDGFTDLGNEIDADSDGVFDATEDLDGDGNFDNVAEVDIDGDGRFDVINENNIIEVGAGPVVNGVATDLDINGDGVIQQTAYQFDLDGDGRFDLGTEVDIDGDGRFDLVSEDLDNDGFFDEIDEDVDGDGTLDLFAEDVNRNGDLDTASRTYMTAVNPLTNDVQDLDIIVADALYVNGEKVVTSSTPLAAGSEGISGVIEKRADGTIKLGENSFVLDDTTASHVLTADGAATEIVLGGDAPATVGVVESVNIRVANNLDVDGTANVDGVLSLGDSGNGAVTDVASAINVNNTNSIARDGALGDRIDLESLNSIARDGALSDRIDTNSSRIASNKKDIEQNTRGIAMVAALQHTTVLPGMKNAFDLSAAHFEGETGLALNFARRLSDNVQINFGAASTTDFDESVIKAGIGVQW